MLFALYDALQDSTYAPMMDEILEDEHLDSYTNL